MTTPNPSSPYSWTFFRAGGVDQVALRNGNDLGHLPQLDPKLWVALACPTRGVEFDPRFLDLIDTDKDGRIRVPEVLETVQWLSQVLRNLDDVVAGGDTLSLSALNDSTPQGKAVLAGAKRLLDNLGKPEATSIGRADLADTSRLYASARFNGDGIVPADSADDTETQRAIADIIATQGSVPDRGGKPGIDLSKLDAFFAQAKEYVAWQSRLETDRTLSPAGDATQAAVEAVRAVRTKVDDYFARCRLAEFDARATGPLNRAEAEFVALADKDLSQQTQEIARLPLAKVGPNQPLPLKSGLNPAWSRAVANLAAHAVKPIIGDTSTLSEQDWKQLQAKLAPYEAWLDSKPKTMVEPLGLKRVRDLLASNERDNIAALIAQDAALQGENAQITAVEKLLLIKQHFYRFLHNFVNFADFYARRGATFQAGTLYLDGRSCDLCLHVSDAGKHATLAGFSAAYLAYCDCTRPGGQKMSIVAAFTDGDSDRLLVGRNGVFYDRQGRDWDATIARIVANPISLREAFWAPYKKFVRLIEEQVAKRAAAADERAQAKLTTAATAAANVDKTKPDLAAPKKIDVGTVAAIGVAVGGIGAMVTGILASFFGLGMWMPAGVVAILLLISGPSMLLAYLKLRQRNLGPILDANGWAINGRARINVPFGKALTNVAALPKGSERSFADPYAEKGKPWKTLIFLAVLVAAGVLWYIGKLDNYLPGAAKSTTVLGTNAPAFTPPAEAPK